MSDISRSVISTLLAVPIECLACEKKNEIKATNGDFVKSRVSITSGGHGW
jgi:hypothetical protein